MHIGSRVERIEKSAKWLSVGAAMGDLANKWAGRRDLVVYAGPDGGQDIAPAFFDPARGEIEVNTSLAFGDTVDPVFIGDLRDRQVLSEWARAGGLLLHEAMHAKYSTADWADLYEEAEARWGKVRGRMVMEVYKLLEEPRIESRGVRDWPRDKGYLRASALWIVEGGLTEEKKAKIAAGEIPAPTPDPVSVALLILGRVDAGVLKATDVRKMKKLVIDMWTKPVFDDIRRLWKEFHYLDDSNWKQAGRMLEISEEILRKLPTPPEEAKKIQEQAEQGDGDPQQGGGSGSGSGEGGKQLSPAEQALADALADAMAEAGEKSGHGGVRESQDEAARQAAEERLAKKEEERKRHNENKKQADNVFNNTPSHSNSYSYGTERGRSGSRVDHRRDPTSMEHMAAGQLTRALKRAKYRDREERRVRQEDPPGRLHGGAAMRIDAARTQALSTKGYDPFRRTKRIHVDDPALSVGIMCDISGSMGGTMEPMAVAVWTVAEAVRRIPEATAASVYFGRGIFPTLKPGEKLKQVTVYTAPDGGHRFDEAFRALDGGLNLLDGHGARLLVVCSDGIFEDAQVTAVRKWLQECRKNGVAVVWLGLKEGYAKEYCETAGSGVEYVEISGSPTGAAAVIGRAMEKALTTAGAGR